MKPSLTSWFRLILQKVTKMVNRIYKAIQSAYCGNQCFSIFTACYYFNVDGKIKNSNVIVVTERSDHDRVASMSCFKKVVSKIESKHGKCYENSYV